MGLVVHVGDWDYEKPVLFACVASHDCRAVVRSRLVGAQHLFREALLEVDHETFVKFQVTHIVYLSRGAFDGVCLPLRLPCSFYSLRISRRGLRRDSSLTARHYILYRPTGERFTRKGELRRALSGSIRLSAYKFTTFFFDIGKLNRLKLICCMT